LIEVLKVKLSYFNVITSKQEDREQIFTLKRDNTLIGQPNFLVDRQKNRVITAEALTEAKIKGDSGDYSSARDVIENAINILNASISASDEFVKTLLNDLVVSLSGLQDRQSYTSYGGYQMASYSSSHHQQRGTHTTTSYTTSARVTMRSKLDM